MRPMLEDQIAQRRARKRAAIPVYTRTERAISAALAAMIVLIIALAFVVIFLRRWGVL